MFIIFIPVHGLLVLPHLHDGSHGMDFMYLKLAHSSRDFTIKSIPIFSKLFTLEVLSNRLSRKPKKTVRWTNFT